MAHEVFRNVRFKADSLARIEECNDIIDDYQQQGLKLTLRQLYYQLVTKNIIPNALVSDARLSGKMDWEAIEDRVRTPRMTSEWENIGDLVESAVAAYRLPRWRDQANYVELWVEKDALAGVLDPIRREENNMPTNKCPGCGYPDTTDGAHYKGIYTPGRQCPHCEQAFPTELEPPDLKQCQADKPNGHNFMTLGGVPGLERCKAKPIVIIKELQPGKDGRYGSMSLCAECWKQAVKQLGWHTFSAEPI
jgi:hypothetical protein